MHHCKSIVVLDFLFAQIMPAAANISSVEPPGTPLVSAKTGNGPIGFAVGDFDGDGIVASQSALGCYVARPGP